MSIQEYENSQEELIVDTKKRHMAFITKRFLLYKVLACTFIFFFLMTFILPKKYMVETDLFINKANNTNMSEFNPYTISSVDAGGGFGLDKDLNNELALMQSPLVMEKVIRENDIRIKKFLNIIPTRKTGQYVPVEKFLKKNISFEIEKGTNVIHISYKNKERELAYNVVNSIIKNYIELHKEINSTKSQFDKKLIEEEYNKAKAELQAKIDEYNGLPSNAVSGSGNLAAMSAFSESARNAILNMAGQVQENERSKIAINEESERVSQLAKKLQWAELVSEMSESSKVLVIREPELPEEYEQHSPKLLKQILFGIIFGLIFGFIAIIHTERHSKTLTYFMLGDNIIYDFKKELLKLKSIIFVNNSKFGKTLLVTLSDILPEDLTELQTVKNIRVVKAEISEDFVNVLKEYENVILLERIGESETEKYNNVKKILDDVKKPIITEVLM